MSPATASGVQVWRPATAARVLNLLGGLTFIVASIWLVMAVPTSPKNEFAIGTADLVGLILLPVATFRWRMELDADVLSLVFIRARRIPVRQIVGARSVVQDGLTFVLENGRTESFAGLGNSPWAHRRDAPTRADLAARAVLAAAAEARGEAAPVDYRLPKLSGYKEAASRDLVWSFIVGLFLGD